MKNLTEYNVFVNINKNSKINEEVKPDTGNAGGGGDMYFANVKGNLAGAENTLVGAAVLKFMGFAKRKLIQMYMKKVLKPRLGRVYMNGILRYAQKEGIGNFSRKKEFEINQIVDKRIVEFDQKVSFKNGEKTGLGAFVEGAEVIKTNDEKPLETGKYILTQMDARFYIEDGKITKIDDSYKESVKDGNISDISDISDDIVDTNVTEDDFKKYKDKHDDELKKLKENGIGPEKWAVDECESVKSKLNLDNIEGAEDIALIKSERMKLLDGVKILNKSIKELNDMLSMGKDNVPNYNELFTQKYVQTANMNELFKLADYLEGVVNDYNKYKKTEKTVNTNTDNTKETEKPKVVNKNIGESYLYEADEPVVVSDKKLKKQNIAPTNISGKLKDVKTSRLGDELQEIVDSGDAIDLNAKEFYKQFENEEHRQGVTNEILKDKSSIAKIQLNAERLIGGNEKQQNAWDRMVENVKSMYSKYMDTDKVDPKAIVKNIPEGNLEKIQKENKNSKEGQTTKSVVVRTQLDEIPMWDQNTEIQKNLGKGFVNNDYICTKLTMNNVTSDYIVQKVKEINGLHYYRVIGLIDLDKIIKEKEEYKTKTKKDFTDAVKRGIFTDIIGPVKPMKDGGKIVAVYIVRNKPLQFGSNTDVTLLYLYSTSSTGGVNFDNATTFYTIKKKGKEKQEIKLPNSFVNKKDFKFNIEIYALGTWKITYPDSAFGIDPTQKFDIGKESSLKKMKGIESIYSE